MNDSTTLEYDPERWRIHPDGWATCLWCGAVLSMLLGSYSVEGKNEKLRHHESQCNPTEGNGT